MPDCDRCFREYEDLQTIELREEHEICQGCVRSFEEDVFYYDWQDRYTEEQHERALSLFSERDEIECVISSYEDGQVIVHTRYVSSDVITDFCNHFGYQILSFSPQWSDDAMWPCMTQHGDIFEIVLEYNHDCPHPVPTSTIFQEPHIGNLDGNDKQFR